MLTALAPAPQVALAWAGDRQCPRGFPNLGSANGGDLSARGRRSQRRGRHSWALRGGKRANNAAFKLGGARQRGPQTRIVPTKAVATRRMRLLRDGVFLVGRLMMVVAPLDIRAIPQRRSTGEAAPVTRVRRPTIPAFGLTQPSVRRR